MVHKESISPSFYVYICKKNLYFLFLHKLTRVEVVGDLAGPLKALVWFWLIDETLSANLVYKSDYEIGSTTLSDEAMTKIMTMVIAWWWSNAQNLEKKKEKNKRLKAKVYLIGAIFILVIKTLSECNHI